jgi:glyoxylase-like metal-dependent hydrolase (beta-lactamase superfamily II)
MPEEVFPDISRIEIPLPGNPLRAINSYVIRGRDRCLMVDTGMNRPECLDAMRSSLAALRVDLGRTDFFVTHCHSDHVGLVSELKTEGSQIYLSPTDAAHILDPALWADMAVAARMHGFPDAEAGVDRHPGRRYLFSGRPQFTHLREGDALPIGRYTFRCVATPGHTPGHLCLYEAEVRILFSGDHILDTITPNISGWGREGDPLGEFLESLDKVAAYDIRLILPGHRNLIGDHRRRIEELKEHHRCRTEEVVGILGQGSQTAYQVASQMTWNIACARWEGFPVPQKWFATGEALAHLLHLERAGQVTRSWRDGTAYFSP